jgi:HEPN domain-containing protein
MVTYLDARRAAEAIRKAVDPFSIFLFGSVARKGVGNDLDLLVLVDEKGRSIRDIELLIHRSLKPYYSKFSIDPFVFSLSKWFEYHKKGSPFLHLLAREGKVLFMKNIVEEWTRQAREELEMATYLLGGGYLKGACYHAQQAVEKAMKAGLFRKGWELEKTHSSARLAAIGKDLKLKFPLLEDEITFMDSIYRGRYPAEAGLLPLGLPSKEEAERAVKIAEKMLKSIEKKASRPVER